MQASCSGYVWAIWGYAVRSVEELVSPTRTAQKANDRVRQQDWIRFILSTHQIFAEGRSGKALSRIADEHRILRTVESS